MWQSRVEIEGYSVAYFDRIAAFKAPSRWTSVKGRAHTCFVVVWICNESTKRMWAPPFNGSSAIRRFEGSDAIEIQRDELWHSSSLCISEIRVGNWVRQIIMIAAIQMYGFFISIRVSLPIKMEVLLVLVYSTTAQRQSSSVHNVVC